MIQINFLLLERGLAGIVVDRCYRTVADIVVEVCIAGMMIGIVAGIDRTVRSFVDSIIIFEYNYLKKSHSLSMKYPRTFALLAHLFEGKPPQLSPIEKWPPPSQWQRKAMPPSQWQDGRVLRLSS